jgi:hypothetical protein
MKRLILIGVLLANAASASPELDACIDKLIYLTDLADESRIVLHNQYYSERTPRRESLLNQPVPAYDGKVDRIEVITIGHESVATNVTARLRANAAIQGERCMALTD